MASLTLAVPDGAEGGYDRRIQRIRLQRQRRFSIDTTMRRGIWLCGKRTPDIPDRFRCTSAMRSLVNSDRSSCVRYCATQENSKLAAGQGVVLRQVQSRANSGRLSRTAFVSMVESAHFRKLHHGSEFWRPAIPHECETRPSAS